MSLQKDKDLLQKEKESLQVQIDVLRGEKSRLTKAVLSDEDAAPIEAIVTPRASVDPLPAEVAADYPEGLESGKLKND